MLMSLTRGARGYALVAALLSCLLFAGIAAAVHVPQLTDAITDQTGVLEEDRTGIQDALEQLFDRTGVQLYVLFVETTDGADITTFAREVGDENLAPRDALVVVALTDRSDTITIGPELADEVSQTSLDRVRTDVLEEGLADGEFGAAVISTVNALGDVFPQVAPTGAPPTVVPASPGPVVTPGPGQPQPGGTGGGSSLLPIVGVLLIIGGLAWVVLRMVRLRTERRVAFEEAERQEQLGREANQLLIKTDDALRDAEQELGFAEAEFGADLSRPMKEALTGARTELNAAFAVGQQLDDSVPETAEQRRQMIEEVIARSRAAQEVVDKQAAALQRLRDLERNAPEALTRLEADLARVEGRIAQVEQARARLSRFAEASTESVAGNVEAARQKVEQARQRIVQGREFLDSDKGSAAAIRASEAGQALADASTLLDAVTTLADSLEEAEGKLKAQLTEAAQDIETARAQLKDGSAVNPAFSQAEAALNEARSLADAPRPDVLAALRKATEANALADKVLEGIRDAQVQRQRAHQNATAALTTARADLARARAYVDGYRHSQQIGREARNRLVTAERLIGEAEASVTSDPSRALELARQADTLATEALSLAQQPGPSYGPVDSSQVNRGDDLGSLVIGAILGGIFSGSGRGGGGFGLPTGSARPRGDIFGGGRRGGGWGGGRSSSGGFGSGGFRGGFGGRSGGFGGGRSSSGRW